MIVAIGPIATGWGALLTGMRRIGDLARMSIWGTLAGAALSIPFVYVWGIGGCRPIHGGRCWGGAPDCVAISAPHPRRQGEAIQPRGIRESTGNDASRDGARSLVSLVDGCRVRGADPGDPDAGCRGGRFVPSRHCIVDGVCRVHPASDGDGLFPAVDRGVVRRRTYESDCERAGRGLLSARPSWRSGNPRPVAVGDQHPLFEPVRPGGRCPVLADGGNAPQTGVVADGLRPGCSRSAALLSSGPR